MNRLRELSSQVMDVYQSLSQEFSAFQSSQSLNCVEKCGACCNKPDIEVSPLEMLPFALQLNNRGAVLILCRSISMAPNPGVQSPHVTLKSPWPIQQSPH